uniref:Uncharacterized protein n=1 Tax=Meloidogyne javanica TaxID=6303 RepID=A0A915MJ36_MELJA
MFKILIPIFFTIVHFYAIADCKKFFLKVTATVSNGNEFQRIVNHEYKRFCVHMICGTQRGHQIIEGEDGNREFYVLNNNEIAIEAPSNCKLNKPITFHITHAIRYGMRGQHCFANGGVVDQSDYNIWPNMSEKIKKFKNTQNAEGYVNIEYYTHHSLDEYTRDDEIKHSRGEPSGTNPSEGDQSDSD